MNIRRRGLGFIVLFITMSGAIYAQDLQFDGYLNSGLGIVYSDADYSDVFLKAFGVDSEQNGYRFRLNGSYTGDTGNAGLRFRFQSQSRLDQGGYFSLPFVYGWMMFMFDAVYLAAGIVDDSSWRATDWYINDGVGEGLGALLKIRPVKGLNLGFGAYIISQQASGPNNILSFGGYLPNFSTITPRIGDAKYVYSGSYTVPGIFWLGAAFRWKNKAGWNGTTDIEKYGYIYDGRQESAQLIGEFRFLGIRNLTAMVSTSLDNLEEFTSNGNIIVSQTSAYRINNTTLGLNMAEFLYRRRDPLGVKIPYDPGFIVNLWGSLAVGAFVPRLDFVYFTGGQSRVGGDETYMWHRRAYVNQQADKTNADDNRNRSVFGIRPSARLNLNGSTFVEIGDLFNYDFANFDGAYGDFGDPKKRSRLSNVFYIDLKWSF